MKARRAKKEREFREKEFSKRSLWLPKTEFPRIMKIAEEMPSVISLGPGEPDFVSSKQVRDYSKQCLDRGFTHYSAIQGRVELREALCKKLSKENKIGCEPDEIIVTGGSIQALGFGVMSLIDPGEGVVIPNPGYMAYAPIVEALNGFPQYYKLNFGSGFQLDPDEIRKGIDNQTRAIIINSPNNPTGVVYKKKLLEEIAEIAVEKELMIISDEAYERLVYGDARHFSIAALNGMRNRVLSLYSFSKTYAMPGFRVGYAVGPEWMIKSMTNLQHAFAICAPTIGQKAAWKAVTSSQKPTQVMLREYDRRRKMIVKRIAEIEGIELASAPEGAFYVFPKFKAKMSSRKFFELLLNKAKVLIVPGTEFGSNGEGFVRLSYATAYEKIEVALDRIERALKGL